MDPADKYKDKVDPVHNMVIDTIIGSYHTMRMLQPHIDKVLAEEKTMHSVGHILQPELYRDMVNSPLWGVQVKVMKAATEFVRSVKKAADELEEAQRRKQG